MQKFFERLKLEREDVREDLEGIDPKETEWRIGDFGCGCGLPTLCLILELHPSECIGIDQFINKENIDVPSLEEVQCMFTELRNYCSSELLQNNSLKKDICHLLDIGKFPTFVQGDVVTGTNLPSNLDMAYCKLLFNNIFVGAYASNDLKGEDGVFTAIKNITDMVKTGGWVCAIEKAGNDFRSFFELVGLQHEYTSRINRGEIIGSKRVITHKSQFIKYIYKKM